MERPAYSNIEKKLVKRSVVVDTVYHVFISVVFEEKHLEFLVSYQDSALGIKMRRGSWVHETCGCVWNLL